MSFYSQPENYAKAASLVDKQLADGWTPDDVTVYFRSLGETDYLIGRIRSHMIRKMISKNPWCRRYGCQTSVPAGGGYVGMPQSHCYRCGKITSGADVARCTTMPYFVEPIGTPDWIDKFFWKIAEILENRDKRRKSC